MGRFTGLLGIAIFIFIAWLLSTDRKKVNWRTVAWGIGIQLTFAVLILPESFFNTFIKDIFNLEMAPGAWFFGQLNGIINGILEFTEAGTDFLIFSSTLGSVSAGFENFIFRVLPTILFFSSIMAILYYLGIIQKIVSGIASLMAKTMRTSGAESLSAAANIFVGQTEAPLVIRPYVQKMTRSELMAVMTGGMATVAGGIMAAYVAFLSDVIPDIAGHLIAASVMSAPAALVMAKILVPETEKSATGGAVKMKVERTEANVIDATAKGASDGLVLAMNIGAMLLVFIAIIALINYPIKEIGMLFGVELSLEKILGYVMAPLAWVMGVPWSDAGNIGSLLGQKTIINEFVAFHSLSELVHDVETETDYRSVVIATYALAGFSNFSSIAIQIGGIGSIAPERKSDLARLGLRALVAGSFACFMTASIAGVLTPDINKSSSLVNKDAAVSEKILTKPFSQLARELKTFRNIKTRRQVWLQAEGGRVNWRGIFFSAEKAATGGAEDAIALRFYHGIKPAEKILGTEPDAFTIVYIDRNDYNRYKEKLEQKEYSYTAVLSGFQPSETTLFKLTDGTLNFTETQAQD